MPARGNILFTGALFSDVFLRDVADFVRFGFRSSSTASSSLEKWAAFIGGGADPREDVALLLSHSNVSVGADFVREEEEE